MWSYPFFFSKFKSGEKNMATLPHRKKFKNRNNEYAPKTKNAAHFNKKKQPMAPHPLAVNSDKLGSYSGETNFPSFIRSFLKRNIWPTHSDGRLYQLFSALSPTAYSPTPKFLLIFLGRTPALWFSNLKNTCMRRPPPPARIFEIRKPQGRNSPNTFCH